MRKLHFLLSIISCTPCLFTPEHFRITKLLAIPMTVSIHRAQLYEWAAIYASERKKLLERFGSDPSSLARRSIAAALKYCAFL